jgi:precorrin isomerase
MMDYLRDPSAIYEKSFAIIRGETDLSGLPVSAEAIAIRMIHACGMTDQWTTCGYRRIFRLIKGWPSQS